MSCWKPRSITIFNKYVNSGVIRITSSKFILENSHNRTDLPKFYNFSYKNLYRLENTIFNTNMSATPITKTVNTRRNGNDLKPKGEDA